MSDSTLSSPEGSDDNWPHAPPHWLAERGTFFVTASTLGKAHHFGSRKRLRYLHSRLLELVTSYHWELQAWAVFSNHYHWVGMSPESEDDAGSLSSLTSHLHADTARWLNQLDNCSGRKIWHNYRESRLTYEKSWLTRLNYVHQNPVKHGLVPVANQYPWCSASWFEQNYSSAHVKTVCSFKAERLNVEDDFEVYKG